MRDQTINSSPNVSISSPQVEPLIVGNANGIIRFLGTLSVLLMKVMQQILLNGNIIETKQSVISMAGILLKRVQRKQLLLCKIKMEALASIGL